MDQRQLCELNTQTTVHWKAPARGKNKEKERQLQSFLSNIETQKIEMKTFKLLAHFNFE